MRLPAPATLRERLALTAALVTAVALVVLTLAFDLVLSRALRASADDVLRSRAEATAAALDVAPDGTLRLRDLPRQRGTWVFEGSTALVQPYDDRDERDRAATLTGRGEQVLQTREPDAVRF